MGARQAPALSEPEAASEQQFRAWLDENSTPAIISEKHDQFYAYCFEFGISGSGATKEAAVEDAVNLLMRYLIVPFSEGRRYKDTKKSPPAWVRLRSWYLIARGRFLRKVKPLSRLGRLTSVPTTDYDAHRLAH